MASSDEQPAAMPPGDGSIPPGKAMTVGQCLLDKGAQMSQSLKPIKSMSLHACSFAMYSHDMNRQIQIHHYISRLNQDFLQSAVYDSDESTARLIGVEYIVSEKIFNTLPPEEQRLWHSHGYEVFGQIRDRTLLVVYSRNDYTTKKEYGHNVEHITSGMWVNPRVPEMIQKPELRELARTYGKFWCTWQVDRGDRLPLGAPALMVSPQGVNKGMVKAELIEKRDKKYEISSEEVARKRDDIAVCEMINPHADYWMNAGKGFAIDVKSTQIKSRAPFP